MNTDKCLSEYIPTKDLAAEQARDVEVDREGMPLQAIGLRESLVFFPIQKTKSTWVDIIIHTLINGSGFLLVAFGVVG